MRLLLITLFILINPLSAFSQETITGEWLLGGAICTTNHKNVNCPSLNSKVKINFGQSTCQSEELLITPIKSNDTTNLVLNTCSNQTDTAFFKLFGGEYVYTESIPTKSDFEIHLETYKNDENEFLKILIYSYLYKTNTRYQNTFYYSRNLIP